MILGVEYNLQRYRSIEMVKKNYVDVKDAVNELNTQPDVWNRHQARLDTYDGPHSQLSDVWVRYNAIEKLGTPAFMEPHESVWYPVVQQLPATYQLVMKLVRDVGALQLGGVLITKIPAGACCKQHVDKGWHAGWYSKFAIQLASAPGQEFCFENSRLAPNPGDLYTFDNSNLHWVTNPTAEDRMTLIICLKVDPNWRSKFTGAMKND